MTHPNDLVAALERAADLIDEDEEQVTHHAVPGEEAAAAEYSAQSKADAALLRSHARLCQEYREAEKAYEAAAGTMLLRYNADRVRIGARRALLASIRGETPTDHTQQEEGK